jgi:beta-ribofuranosylaminobenzene 5'-phosphate synthase
MVVAPARSGNSTGDDAASAPVECVQVNVPARLHVGFLDLHGGLGRRYGSLGISLDAPQTRIRLRRADALAVDGPSAARARAYLQVLIAHFALDERLHLEVEEAIPEHVGLGSGTQLSLATAVACCRLHGLVVDLRTLALLLDRGLRSSIGIASFEQGGVILDGGRGEAELPPPVLARLPFPEAWRVLLIFDQERHGLHGKAELDAFAALPTFPSQLSAHLCRLALLVTLPALAEQDLDRFGDGLAELQRAIGDYFATVQGGARYTSPPVAAVLAWLESEGLRGIGQSSWGPTGFAILGSEDDAARVVHALEHRWPAASGLRFVVSRGRNHGGEIITDES